MYFFFFNNNAYNDTGSRNRHLSNEECIFFMTAFLLTVKHLGILQLCGLRTTETMRKNLLLLLHGILFQTSSKGSFIFTISHTG